MDAAKKRGLRDRSKINTQATLELKYWMHHLDVSREQLLSAVDKVGDSAAAVRKELRRVS